MKSNAVNATLLALFLTASPFFLGGCAVIKWLSNPQPRVEYSPEDYARPEAIVGSSAVVYRPALGAFGNDRDQKLLRDYAPILVQGVLEEGNESYPRDSDFIGAPMLRPGEDQEPRVWVNTASPRVYTQVDTLKLDGLALTRLTYSHWYPRHPVGGIQKGDVDGGVVRVTLDPGERPILYEFVFPCGCYHGSFVSDQVEAWSMLEHLRRDEDKLYFSEKHRDDRISWVIRDVVVGARTHKRPVVFLGAGSHDCKAIQTEALVSGLGRFREIIYGLEPYEELTRLESADGRGRTASLFNEEGLVWGGRRWGEEIIFTSMDHPGWPRRLDKIRIHWDEELFTDPNLLSTFLRLPTEAISENARTLVAGRKRNSTSAETRPIDDAEL